MDDGKHDILPVAGAILDRVQAPVMRPRQSDADMRRDGSTTAQTVPSPPSMRAEECTAPQDSQAENRSTRWWSNERRVSQNSASPDPVESRRRRWPRREKDPRLRGQDKASCLAAGTSFLSVCLHIVFRRLSAEGARCAGAGESDFPNIFNAILGGACNVRRYKFRRLYACASISTLQRYAAILGLASAF